eukprot:GHVT01010899.1.p1 GENE.GHVT01010899.1~~GHVT01010899.1.p1  ORF type:complete len:105 (+),score=13.73 GHVT01010899.1:414-728(+)
MFFLRCVSTSINEWNAFRGSHGFTSGHGYLVALTVGFPYMFARVTCFWSMSKCFSIFVMKDADAAVSSAAVEAGAEGEGGKVPAKKVEEEAVEGVAADSLTNCK